MAPVVPALAQSESKARFFSRLGLDPTNNVHKRVYALMKMDAAEGRRRLMASQTSSTAQIHEAAWTKEVARIYRDARPETRACYKFGQNTELSEPDNWIIRWMLWHVFRYRDYRNKSHPPGSPSPSPAAAQSSEDEQGSAPPETDSQSNPVQELASGESESSGASVVPASTAVPVAIAAAAAAAAEDQSAGSSTSPSQYWDPVRDQWQS